MRLGIVGCGLIGRKRGLAAARGNVVVVYDTDSRRARELAGEVGARVAVDLQDLIAADIDVVVVATRHDDLSKIACAALEGGKHVLVEKPAGRTTTEALAVMEACRKAGRVAKVGFNHRFHPAFLKAREVIDSGGLGPLMFVRARYGHGGRVGYDKEWRCVPEIAGGGELIDQGSHLIDLARWILGDLTLDYGAAMTTFWDIPVDDNCFLALRGSRGEMAWLHASWTEWKNTFSFEIYGRNAKMSIDGLGGSYGTEKLTLYKMLPAMGPPDITTWEFSELDESWALELADLAEAIQLGRAPIGDIGDAVAMHTIIDQVYGR